MGFLSGCLKQKKYRIGKKITVLLLILSGTTTLWFYNAKVAYDIYGEAIYLQWSNPQLAIQKIKQIYHPIFRTTNGVRLSYDVFLANSYLKLKENTLAKKHYEEALRLAPYSEADLLVYGRFALNQLKDPDKARELALRAYSIQENNYSTNLLLAKIAFQNRQLEVAEEYLKAFDNMIKEVFDNSVDSLQRLKPSSLIETKITANGVKSKSYQQKTKFSIENLHKVYRNFLLEYHHLQAQINTETQNWSSASSHWEKAIALSQNPSVDWYNNLLQIYLRKNEVSEARQVVSILLEKPFLPDIILVNIVKVLKKQENFELAETITKRIRDKKMLDQFQDSLNEGSFIEK